MLAHHQGGILNESQLGRNLGVSATTISRYVENLLSVTPTYVQPFTYNTPGGAEIDLVLEFSTTEKWAIEIKRNSTPTMSKGFHVSREDIQPQKSFVVYAGNDRFELAKGITAISLTDLMKEIVSKA